MLGRLLFYFVLLGRFNNPIAPTMKLSISTLLISTLLVSGVYAQRPEGIIMKASISPVIDAEVDEVWAEANVYDINKPFRNELPTVDGTTWKALWDEFGIYVLVECLDDAWLPNYLDGDGTGPDYMYDKPEVHIDVNIVLEDGVGAASGNGHFMLSPGPQEGKNDGTALTTAFQGGTAEATYSITVTEPDANYEYFIPFEALEAGDGIDVTEVMGFDVTMVDRDPGDAFRKRAVWANVGLKDESWNNMDDVGYVTFDGAQIEVYVESLSIKDAVIGENNGSVQIISTIFPENADVQSLKWSIEDGTGRATIDKDGVVTGILDGTVTVTAQAKDGSWIEDQCTVTIKNQIVSIGEINLIRNGFMDQVNKDGSAAEWDNNRQVVDGAMYIPATEVQHANWWEGGLSGQSGFGCNATDTYTFSFVMWSEAADTFYIDFDDPANGYNRYGTSMHEYAFGLHDGSLDGQSQWEFVTNVDPTYYLIDEALVFNELKSNTNEKLNLMGGLHGKGGVYIDSIILINNNDKSLLTSGYIPVDSIKVSGPELVPLGASVQMSAAVAPDNAMLKDVRWSVVNGSGVARIDSAGILVGDSVGLVTVIAHAKDDSNVKGMLDVIIKDDYILVESIVVSGETDVFADSTAQMYAEVSPVDALLTDVKWSVVNGSGEASISESGLLTGLSEGSVTVMASAIDGSNVSGLLAITIVDCYMSDTIDFDALLTNVSCFGADEGSIDITVSGPNAPFTYKWSNGFNTEDLSNVPAGTYKLTIRDVYHCRHDEIFDITQPSEIKIDSIEISSPQCAGDNIASLSLSLSGGAQPYTLYVNQEDCVLVEGVWVCDSLEVGLASIVITDASGCILEDSIIISEPQAIEIILDASGGMCHGDSLGSINSFITGGLPPYSFNWSTGDITQDLRNLAAGEYQLTVSDSNDCSNSQSAEITQLDRVATSDITGLKVVSEADVSIYSVNQTPGSIFSWIAEGGNIIAGLSGNSITVQWGETGEGTISVCETDKYNCSGDTVTLEVQIEALSGINSKTTPEFVIYPNPGNGNFTIETGGSDFYEFEITSLNGKSILNGNIDSPTQRVDLSSFPKGVYFISLKSVEYITTKKLIKL